MFGPKNNVFDTSAEYKEETIKGPVLVTIAALLLVSIPLVLLISKINNEGMASTNISKYDALTKLVASDVRVVDAMIRHDAQELAAINANNKGQTVTLIVPEVVIVDEHNRTKKVSPLNIQLEGIYWSAANPLVGIDGDTHRVGDKIRGYEIVRIGKTAVQFQADDGTIVVKDMYDNLLQK